MNSAPPSVTSYAMPWTGTPTPATRLSGRATQLGLINYLAVDETHGELVITSLYEALAVHPLSAHGNPAPLRTLTGNRTELSLPFQSAVDPVNDEIFVPNTVSNLITVYKRTADGHMAPIRRVGPTSAFAVPLAVAVDPTHDELVVLSRDGTRYEVVVLARTASGPATALRTIRGESTQLAGTAGMAVDSAHGEFFVLNRRVPSMPSIAVFSRTAQGNVVPRRTLIGPSMGLSAPSGLTVCK
jgi:hypothetical protein